MKWFYLNKEVFETDTYSCLVQPMTNTANKVIQITATSDDSSYEALYFLKVYCKLLCHQSVCSLDNA